MHIALESDDAAGGVSAGGGTSDGAWVLDRSSGYGSGSLVAEIMIQAGSALMNNMSLLFALGVATGLADEQDGTARSRAWLHGW